MNDDETEMAEAYALLRGFQLTGQLGAGLNGRVWKVRDNHKRAWPQVQRALRELKRLGIYYLDVHRGNIAL